MNINQLIEQFNHGINWNAYFYIIYKSISTFLTFLLYHYLTPYDFTLWAITNSTIYIMLLWADLGLRKSIPRYSPVFAQDPAANKRFIQYIVIFYAVILSILSIFFTAGIMKAAHAYLENKTTILYIVYCAPAIFIFEGINNVSKLIFHAYFFIKKFNILATLFLLINLALDLIVICTYTTSSEILGYMFINKAVAGCALAITSLILFFKSKPETNFSRPIRSIAFNKTMQSFTQHSGIMWINTILKSLSERNSLVPLIALFGGAQSASIFKMANDGALLFQRIVLKTIGTTDTSLLAHIETGNEEEKLLQVAFTKLAQKVAALCLPLMGIGLYIGISSLHSHVANKGFQLFILLTFFYLIEVLLLPYERVLEVKHAYKKLMIAYAPYVIFLFIFLFYISKTWIGLIPFISLIYIVRLVSVCIMVFYAHHVYHVRYPFTYTRDLFGFICSTSIGLYIVTYIININPYTYFLSLFSRFNK